MIAIRVVILLLGPFALLAPVRIPVVRFLAASLVTAVPTAVVRILLLAVAVVSVSVAASSVTISSRAAATVAALKEQFTTRCQYQKRLVTKSITSVG